MAFLRSALAIFAFVLFFSVSSPVFADENFEIGLVSSYIVRDNGLTTIEQQFTLTNRMPTRYASQYAIEVGSNKVQNVKVFDKNGAIPANIVSSDKKTSIAISFEDIIVGEGKSRQFTVQFESPDIAIISGNVVEVYIPRFSDLARYDSYKVELRVPERFGQPARVNPQATRISQSSGYTLLEFSNLGDRGVTAIFGEKQVYDFILRYHLENPTQSIGVAQVALPPDTSYQKMHYHQLEPRPEIIEKDKDGNWIATYEVSAGRETEVVLSGKAHVYLTPRINFIDPPPRKEHTASQKFWPTQHPKIIELSRQYTSPREVYDYVVENLSYNFNKVNGPVTRLGAVDALEQPDQAACQEFTDLFITMCRAIGVPARRVTGFSYTENERLRPLSLVDDVLHAWPEYYDAEQQRWIAVDPTWGNTTGGLDYFNQLDFNHVAFAINGVSDTTPYPAGSYKRSYEKTKDVEVTFGKDEELPSLGVVITVSKKPFWLAPFQNHYDLHITNTTGLAWYNIPIQVTAETNAASNVRVDDVPSQVELLLPFQTTTIPLSLTELSTIRQTPVRLTLTLQDISSTHDVKTGLQIIEAVKTAPISPVGLGIGLVVASLITGGLLVFRWQRQHSLRR
jgi:transglutaminase-like putative cysteine protease